MRLIENIREISIIPDTVWLRGKSKPEVFKRNEYKLIVEDVKQVEDREIPPSTHRTIATSITFHRPVDCIIDEDKKIIICGKNPAKIIDQLNL